MRELSVFSVFRVVAFSKRLKRKTYNEKNLIKGNNLTLFYSLTVGIVVALTG